MSYYSASTGQTVYTEAEQAEIDDANAALDWIDSLPRRIALLLIEGASRFKLDATKADAMDAMRGIDDALGDLFGKDRRRLMEIAGWRTTATNPGTLAAKGFDV